MSSNIDGLGLERVCDHCYIKWLDSFSNPSTTPSTASDNTQAETSKPIKTSNTNGKEHYGLAHTFQQYYLPIKPVSCNYLIQRPRELVNSLRASPKTSLQLTIRWSRCGTMWWTHSLMTTSHLHNPRTLMLLTNFCLWISAVCANTSPARWLCC